MAIIKAKCGTSILIDDSDFEYLSKFKWYINPYGYAVTHLSKKNQSFQITNKYMHRHLTNCPKGLVVDHLNANRLDNRKENLEVVTASENSKRVDQYKKALTRHRNEIIKYQNEIK